MTEQLIKWYRYNKRDLPWRKTLNPYKIWVSEIILQQTQIKTGIKYYATFIKTFPNIETLASAQEIDVLKIWQGLGYYNRALNMLDTAKTIKKKYHSIFPVKYIELIKLKGVGEYTAAAISSICADEKKAVLDGNVYRVLSRIYNINTPINTYAGKKKFQIIANQLMPNSNTGRYNQAIMDFGSIHCKKNNPQCSICPLKKECQSFQLKLVHNRPIKNKKKKKKIRYFNYLFIRDNNSVIIQQRDNKDIWNKLYEFPLVESDGPISKNELLKNKSVQMLNILDIQHSFKLEHILSHQKLRISFWKILFNNIHVNRRLKKIELNNIHKYPFPQPFKQYFDKEQLII